MGIYKTEPLKCWGKAKELRLGVYEGIQKARDEGTMIVAGGKEIALAIPAGFDIVTGVLWRLQRRPVTPGICVRICVSVSGRCFQIDSCSAGNTRFPPLIFKPTYVIPMVNGIRS